MDLLGFQLSRRCKSLCVPWAWYSSFHSLKMAARISSEKMYFFSPSSVSWCAVMKAFLRRRSSAMHARVSVDEATYGTEKPRTTCVLFMKRRRRNSWATSAGVVSSSSNSFKDSWRRRASL